MKNNQSEYLSVQTYSLVSIQNLFSIYHMTYNNGFIFTGEAHDFWEFGVILEGEGVVISEDMVYFCRKGDGVLHAPNSFHSFKVSDNSHCKMFVISFNGSGLLSNLRSGQYKITEDEFGNINRILSELTLMFGDLDETEFTQFFNTVPYNNPGLQIIKNSLEILCLSLIRRGKSAQGAPTVDNDSKIYAKIITFLKDNVERNLDLTDISKGIYESPGKIKTVFHKFTGGGIMQYFNRLRCEHIMVLLSNGHSVKNISEQMGFSSPYYLSYFFKRETGITAREYLKKNAPSS